MKHIQLVIAAFLVSACVVQVRSGENWEWTSPRTRPGGSCIEMAPPRVIFRKKGIYADDQDPGFRPEENNTKEMIDLFVEKLSGLTPESFLSALGFQRIPQWNALIRTLEGLLLGQAEGKIDTCTVAVFLHMFDVEAFETSTALKAIANVIKEIRLADNPKSANEYLLTPDILDLYYDQSTSVSPISKEKWAEIGILIDQVMEGKRDAAKKIVNFLASHDELLQGLSNTSPLDQADFVQTLSEDVVKFRTFLEYVKKAREAED